MRAVRPLVEAAASSPREPTLRTSAAALLADGAGAVMTDTPTPALAPTATIPVATFATRALIPPPATSIAVPAMVALLA